VSVAPGGDKTLERREAGAFGTLSSGRTKLFDGEACAKGTALVAKAREDAMRDPRSQRATRGGSSGGRARGTSNDRSGRSSRGDARLSRLSATAIAQRTPGVGAGRRETCREIACG
jgi:hypothetical protein